ncbi:hypothetical protein MMSP_3597 [Mycobacterium sp. 012931]|nr:hypothetical protein MMSP_3597 [Mycobacterium sp. 012931]MBC9865045.1 hypothetical protein [Mycobacterium pseudoshottsii]
MNFLRPTFTAHPGQCRPIRIAVGGVYIAPTFMWPAPGVFQLHLQTPLEDR